MSYGETREKKMGDLKVCKSTDPEVEIAAQKIAGSGYLFHSKDAKDRAQWVFGTCDSGQAGQHHGSLAARLMKKLLGGHYKKDGEKLVCLNCHSLPNTTDVFIPKADETTPAPTTFVPACNTCHPFHRFLPDTAQFNMGQFAELPPMDPTKGCPTCHESSRPPADLVEGGSLARETKEVTRFEYCAPCHLPQRGRTRGEAPEEGGE